MGKQNVQAEKVYCKNLRDEDKKYHISVNVDFGAFDGRFNDLASPVDVDQIRFASLSEWTQGNWFITTSAFQYLPKQFCSLHGLISMLDPSSVQSRPPWSGDGLVQERVLVLVPSPQVAEQVVQFDHAV